MNLLAFFLLPFLAACGSLAVPEPALYRLAPATGVTSDANPVAADLIIDTPQSLASLDSARIAFVAPDGHQSFFQNVAWADRAPTMIADDLVQAFQASGAWRNTTRSGSGIHADYLLQGNLTDCEAFGSTQGKTDHVEIAITFTLVRSVDHKPMGSVHLEKVVPVVDTSFDKVIDGFDTALNEISREAMAWSRTTEAGSY